MQAQAAAGTQITTDVNWTIGFLVSPHSSFAFCGWKVVLEKGLLNCAGSTLISTWSSWISAGRRKISR